MIQETWSTRHEFEGLRRYELTHRCKPYYHPIDLDWFKKEFEDVRCLINNDPVRPTQDEYYAIERKHTYWRGGSC